MKKTQTAGGVVVNKEGFVLVVNQKGTSWSLPKGHVEDGENKLNAAKREIYEESGVNNLEFVKELGTYSRHKISELGTSEDKSELKIITMFLFKTNQDTKNLKPLDPENPEARWVPKEEVAALLTHSKDKKFFMGIVKELNQV